MAGFSGNREQETCRLCYQTMVVDWCSAEGIAQIHISEITVNKKKKTHSTNYFNAFIAVAEDCSTLSAETPKPFRGEETAATIQFDMVKNNPYRFTSDDVLFQVHAAKKRVARKDMDREREVFFSKGQPCMRCSPLTKRYGWGVHSNAEGKIALWAIDSKEYKKLSLDQSLRQLKAMRTSRD